MLTDLRFAARLLERSPGPVLLPMAILGAGIGAATLLFGVAWPVLLKPWPYPAPERLAFVQSVFLKNDVVAPSKAADYLDWARESRSFQSMAMVRGGEQVTLTGMGEAERVLAAMATPSLFQVFGVAPKLGRVLAPDEDQPGKERVVVVSEGFWKRRLGGLPKAVGSTLELNGKTHTVIGVMPGNFEFPAATTELWMPLVVPPAEIEARFLHRFAVYGRLRAGVTFEGADRDIASVAAELRRRHPNKQQNTGARVRRLTDEMLGSNRQSLQVLMGAVAFVLLAACANAGNLLLSRTLLRGREFAIRGALGASRWVVARHLLAEALLVGVGGGLIGVCAAAAAIEPVKRLLPALLPRAGEVRLNWEVTGFAVLVSLAASVLAGVGPILLRAGAAGENPLRQRGAAATRGARALQRAFVAAQVALAVAVAAGALMLARSYQRILAVDLGFQTDSIVSARVNLAAARYDTQERLDAFYDGVKARLERAPGIERVALINRVPLDGTLLSGPVQVRGRTESEQSIAHCDHRSVSPDYFETMRIPLLRGRGFDQRDGAAAPPVLLIDEIVAKRYFGDADPVGQVVQPGSPALKLPWSTIVGVVGAVRGDGREAESRGTVYAPTWQRRYDRLSFVVRSKLPEGEVTRLIREAVRERDAAAPVFSVFTMEELVSRNHAPRRFTLIVMNAFAALTLLLAGAGLYGQLTQAIARRTQEIGIRSVLGASPGGIARLVMKEAGRQIAIGALAGCALAFAAARMFQSLLYGLQPADPGTLAAVLTGVAAGALIACAAPLRRALRVDPAAALRIE